MGAIINYSLRVDKLPKEKFIAGKDGAVYVNLTMSVNDETRYGNNASIMISQTQEERESKKPRTYIGNGQVVWTDGNIVKAEREEAKEVVQEAETSDLPF
jgi:hypothetical protein|tara:strand:+ start:430 stop:729 length:300 start_codon:yes stop_codon:yes gene_type:complete